MPPCSRGCAARVADCFAECDPFQHPFVESPCESAGRIIIDGPTGRHDRLHPHTDERLRDAGGKAIGRLRFENALTIDFREMAAVDEEQLRKTGQLLDLAGIES